MRLVYSFRIDKNDCAITKPVKSRSTREREPYGDE